MRRIVRRGGALDYIDRNNRYYSLLRASQRGATTSTESTPTAHEYVFGQPTHYDV